MTEAEEKTVLRFSNYERWNNAEWQTTYCTLTNGGLTNHIFLFQGFSKAKKKKKDDASRIFFKKHFIMLKNHI